MIMAERLVKMFSSPKFKENKTNLPKNFPENISPLLSSPRFNSTQDELSLEMDAKSEGFTSRICDTANSLLLGEFPWETDNQIDYLKMKHKRTPKPVPVRLRIGPPNSSSLLLSEDENNEYDKDEYSSSKSLVQALREMSRKRTYSSTNEESDCDMDGNAPKKACNPVEYRHNLYLSQLEEETQEYKSGLALTQADQLSERNKRGREEDPSLLVGNINGQDVSSLNKRQRRNGMNDIRVLHQQQNDGPVSPLKYNNGINVIPSATTTNNGTNKLPRRGSNEILSSLSSSLTLLDPTVIHKLVKPSVKRKRDKKHRKMIAAETQTLQTITEVTKSNVPESPSKEDKSINTEPEKPAKVIVEEKIVTDKMANALMKSAVSKFLATEDPTLSPVRNPPPSDKSAKSSLGVELFPTTPTTQSIVSPQASTTTTSLSLSGFTPPLSSDKPTNIVNNTSFAFGTTNSLTPTNLNNSNPNTTSQPNVVTPTSTTAVPPQFTFGSAVVNNGSGDIAKTTSTTVTTTTTGSPSGPNFLFTTQSPSSATTQLQQPAGGEPAKQVTFGEKLDMFKPSESNQEPAKISGASTLFQQPQAVTTTAAAAPTTVTSTPASDPVKTATFTFGSLSKPAPAVAPSATTSNNQTVPTFSFGSSSLAASKFTSAPVTFGSSSSPTLSVNDKSKTNLVTPKLSLFGGPAAGTPAQAGAPTTSGFLFSANNDGAKKSDKVEEKKPQGLFSFGASSNNNAATTALTTAATTTTTTIATTSNTTENKPFTFGAAASTSAAGSDVNQPSQQQSKPFFQFGSSSFNKPQESKEGFTFGSKASLEQSASSAPSFGTTTESSLFGGTKAPATISTTTSATTNVTTTPSLFGFGAVQPVTTTTATPSFESVSSAQNNAAGSFNFQPSKVEEKPATGGFTFKFSGTSAPSVDPPKPSFTFGAAAAGQTTTPAFGSSSNTTQPSVFGSVANTTQPPAFGSTAITTQPPAFGSTANTTQPPAFGSTAITTQPPAFGSSSITTQPPAFGSPLTPAPSFSAFSNTTPNPPTFGGGNPATPSFGATAVSATATFGSGTTSAATSQPTFGATSQQQPQPTQTQQAPSFTFGASNPSSGFNFGAQSSIQPPSGGLFQFGASSSSQQNPSAGVSQPFQFGATLPAASPQVAGGQPMFSIGSGSTAARSRQLGRRKK